MKEDTELLLKKVDELIIKDFNSKEEAKHYAHNLNDELHNMEDLLMEEKRKLDDMIWKLRHSESKVFDYYLGIK